MNAATRKIASTTVMMSECGSAPKCSIMKPPPAEPISAPRLQKAWQDDMIALRIDFSTSTALAFIATSMPPAKPPNRKTAMAAVHTFGASEMPSIVNRKTMLVALATTLVPYLAIRAPHNGMMVIEPSPKNTTIKAI